MADTAANPSTFSFVAMEHEILSYWESAEVFHRSLETRRKKKALYLL